MTTKTIRATYLSNGTVRLRKKLPLRHLTPLILTVKLPSGDPVEETRGVIKVAPRIGRQLMQIETLAFGD